MGGTDDGHHRATREDAAGQPGDSRSVANSDTDTGPPSTGTASRLFAVVTGAVYGVLFVLGIFLGIYGAFFFSVSLWVLPAGAIAGIVVNFVACRVAGLVMRTRMGAALPAAGWLLAVVVLAAKRSEGSLIITGTTAGYVFLFGGTAAAVAAVMMTHLDRIKAEHGRLP